MAGPSYRTSASLCKTVPDYSTYRLSGQQTEGERQAIEPDGLRGAWSPLPLPTLLILPGPIDLSNETESQVGVSD
jgi:hypothetical protein